MNSNPGAPVQSEENTFLQTQFLFYLLPCYYGVVAFIYRYFIVLETEPTYYVKHLPGQLWLKYCQPQNQRTRNSQTLTYRVLPASYVIKSRLCTLNTYLYLIMVVFSFLCTPAIFYSAGYRLHSFLYLFGALAWYLSALVLRREQQRNMNQSIWIHRLFWILAGTFSVYKMFEDYFMPINLILNVCLIADNLVLAIYGIYRPQDNDTLVMVTTDDTPHFIKLFFQYLELNERVRYWLGIEDQLNQNLAEDTSFTRPQIDNQDLVTIGHALKRSAQSIKTEINLLNQLPRRNVFVDRKVRYVREGDRFKSCYFILTQVGDSRFEAERTIEEFQQIFQNLSEIFTVQNFPRHVLPRPIGLSGGDERGNISQNMQAWFQQILKTPIFITRQLLDFLAVDEWKSAPFIAYFQNSYPSFCSRHYLLKKHNKKIQTQKQIRMTQFSRYGEDRQIKIHQPTDHQKILNLLQDDFKFTVTVESVVAEEKTMLLNLNCWIAKKKKRIFWDVKKTANGIGLLNQKIEEECGWPCPLYYMLVGSQFTKNRDRINQSCRDYLQSILNNKKYYCTSLFTFIRFDIVKQEVFSLDGGPSFFQSIISGERQSHYIEDYEDRGGHIDVLRVERIKRGNLADRYNLKFRRQELTLFRYSDQFTQLREDLAKIYKGVSFIPELNWKNASKQEVKRMVQNFLLKIQNLPRIQIVEQYHTFYGDHLRQYP